MAFIKCEKCGAIVSNSDNLCPNCGELFYELDEKYVREWWLVFPFKLLIPVIAVSAFLVFFYLSNYQAINRQLAAIAYSTVNGFFNLAFFSLIVVLFCWAVTSFHAQVRRTRRALADAMGYIRDVNTQNLNEKYCEIDSKFRAHEFFKLQWSEFDETLRKINDGGYIRYYNTIDVTFFFNEDSLFFNRFKSAFIFSIPTLLTGVGIFGTFFGLVIGLQPFQNITDFSNSREVGLVTSQLLTGVSTSFLSSLWGMLFSLLLNFYLSFSRSQILQEVELFTEKLEAVFPRHMSAEGEGLFEIKRELEQHTRVLEAFSTTIAQAISQSVGTHLSSLNGQPVSKRDGGNGSRHGTGGKDDRTISGISHATAGEEPGE